MKTFFTSDTHYGHKNILKFCPESRPFESIEAMNENLIERWNALIGPEDHVYHLGDVSFMKQGPTLGVLSRLQGKKFLVYGNHDRISPELEQHWEWVRPYHEMKMGGRELILFHYPIEYWKGGHYKGKRKIWHLHGHSHGGSRFKPGRLDVGVDTIWEGHTTLDPWTFEEIEAFMNATENLPEGPLPKGHHES